MKSRFTRVKGSAKKTGAKTVAQAAHKPSARPPLAYALEPRFMFDAAGAATADPNAAADHSADPAAASHDSTDHAAAQPQAQTVAEAAPVTASVPAPVEVRAADPAQNGGRKEVVFIETNVGDYQTLVASAKSGIEVVVLDSKQDGLSQIAQWAQTHTGYDAIHIISHGAEGEINLGSLNLDTAAIATRTSDLAALGASLTRDGDVLLYGCNVATGVGQNFISAISSVTGADVAASTNPTGAASLGGDWQLEAATGNIDVADPLNMTGEQQYNALLALTDDHTFTFESSDGTSNNLDYQSKTGSYDLTTDGVRLKIESTDENVIDESTNGTGSSAGNGSNWLYLGASNSETSTKFSLTDTQTQTINYTFNLKSLFISNPMNVAQTYVITSDKGSSSSYNLSATSSQTITLSGANFTDISWFTITSTTDYDSNTAGDQFGNTVVDDILVDNIVAPVPNISPVLDASKTPVLIGENQSVAVNAPSGAVGTLVSSLVDIGGSLSNVTDSDSTPSTGIALTAADTSNGSWYYTTDGGTNWNAVGTVSNSSALLLKADANTRLFFKANSGYSGTVTDAITFRAWDQTSGTAGNKIDTSSHSSASPFSSATDTANITVTDDVAPTVSGVSSSTTDNTYGIGSVISIQVTFSEAVTVSGTPQLTLETGATDRTINYTGGTGTNTLTFSYTVQAGDTSSDLDYQSTTALVLNGGTIKDAAGNDATLTLPATGSGSSLAGSKALVIDTAPTITSATYNAGTNTLVVTGTNISNGAAIDVTKLTLTGQGGSTYTLTNNSSVTSTPSSNSFTITLGATDQAHVEGLLNKDSTSAQDNTSYNLAGAANWNSTQSAPADNTGNGITVSSTQKPEISSVTYNATTGVLTVTGTNLVHQPGANNDIDLSKLTITGQGDGTAALTGAVEITSATSFSVTLTGTEKANLDALLNKNGTSSLGGTVYKITSVDDWNGPIYGDISNTIGVGINVSGNNSAPAIGNLDGNSVAWAGEGNTVTLDLGTDATVSDEENGASSWSGSVLTVRRSVSGTATPLTSDVFSFKTNATFSESGGNLLDTANSNTVFGTVTNANGTLSVTFNGSATATLIQTVMRNIQYRNDTPTGDTVIRYTMTDGNGGSTNADVTVTSDTIYVTNNADAGAIDVSNGVSLREAVAIALADATGTQTIKFASDVTSIALTSDLAVTEDLTFDADLPGSLTISGNKISVSSGRALTLTNGSGDTLTISSQITGAGGVTKTGAGTLTLSGGNDYTGATAVSAGTLATSGTGGIGDSSAVTVASGATLSLGGNETIGSLTGSGAVTLGSNTLSVGGDNTNTTFDGIISGTGALTKSGTGTLTLTGTNSYSGTTTVGAGTLALNSSAGTALSDSSAVAVASGATLSLASAAETIGTLSGAGTLALGANTLTLSQTSSQTFSGAITGTSSGNLILNADANSTTLTLSGTSNSTGFAGGITVTVGTLLVSADSNLGAGTVTLNGGVLRLSTTATVDNAIVIGSSNGTVSVNTGTTLSLSGAISGSGSLTKAGAGDLTLSGNNSGFSGAFTINNGTVTVSHANALGSTTGGTTVADGAALALSGGITVAENLTLSGSGVSSGGALISASGTNTVSGTVTLNADATVTTTSGLTLSGVVSGAYALTKEGSGSLTLSGSNSYTGATTVSAGTLVAGHANALGTTAGSTTVSNGATLAIADGITVAEALTVSGSGVSSAGALQVTGGSATLSGAVTMAADTTIGVSGTGLTLSGIVGGSHALTKTGSGMLTLSGDNTYTGATTVSAGVLYITHANALGTTAAGTTIASDATLRIGTGLTVAENLTISGIGVSTGIGAVKVNGGTATISGAITLAADASIGSYNSGDTLTISGIMSGGFNLTKVGGGTVVLSGTNSYTGTTTVSEGTLSIAGSGNISTGTVTLNGGTLDVTGSAVTLANAVALGSSHGTISVGSGSALTLSGVISGANNLAKSGGGALTLSGTGTYTGTTTVGAGTLVVTGTLNGASAGAVTVGNGGTLAGTGTVNGGLTVQSGGTLSPGIAGTDSGVGTLTVNGGLTIQSGGTLAVDLVSTSSHDKVDVTGTVDVNNATLTAGGSYTPVKTSGGDSFIIIANDGSDAVTGTFTGLASGATLTLNSGSVTVSYAAGSNSNDVVLTGPVNQAPVLAGTFTTAGTVNDNATITPFGSVTVSDADDSTGNFSVTITYTAANGILSSAGGGLSGSAGSYTLTSSTPSGLQTLLQGLVFTPTNNQVAPGSTVQTTFTLTASDGATDSSANSSTVVTATSINDAPTDIALSNNSVSIYEGVSAVVGTLSKTDVDTGQTFTYTLVSGTGDTNNALFNISGTSLQAINAGTLTAGQSYSVRIQVSDGTATYQKVFSISVTNDLVVDVTAIDGTTSDTYSGDKADGGGLDLQEAIALANAVTGNVTIRFASTLNGTITLPTTLTVRDGVTLAMDSDTNSRAITITGNGFTLGNSFGVSVGTGDTLTINSTLADNGTTDAAALTKSGDGTLVLGGTNNTAAGNTGINTITVGAGTLQVAGDANLGTGTVTMGGGNLTVTGATTIDNAIALSSDATVDNANAVTLSGAITGTGGLTKTGSGKLTLSSAGNAYSGGTTLRGEVELGTTGTIGSGTITLNGGTLTTTAAIQTLTNAIAIGSSNGTVKTANALTLSGTVSGSGALTKDGAGTVTLSGANTYTGTTTVSAGTLTLNGGSAIADAGAVTVNSGATLTLSAGETIGSLTGSGSVTLGANTLTVALSSGSATFSGAIGGTGGLTKTGTGTLTLSGTNTYSGATTVSGGGLTVSGGSAISNSSAVAVDSGATLTLSANETIGSLAGAGSVALGSYTLSTGASGASTTFSGVLSGSGNLAKGGSGTLTLSGANTYTGTTSISGGTLSVTDATNIGSGTLTIDLGTLAITGTGASFANAITAGTGGATISVSNTATLTGVVGGSGALTKTGTGTLTLSGTNTYSGVTTVSTGTLAVSGASAIADTGAVTVSSGATLELGAAETIGSLSGAGSVTLGGHTLTVNLSGGATTFSGAIGGTGGLTKTGTGTLTLSGANTYTGATTVSGGFLTTLGGSAIGDSSAVTVESGATLILAAAETIGSLAGAGSVTLLDTLTTGADNSTSSFSGVLSGTGGLTKTGTGTLTLSGANSYTGTTSVSGGILSVTGGSAIADGGAVTVNSGATLNLLAAETIGSLAGAGSVTLGANTLTAGGNNGSTTFSGAISGSGGLTKAGTGTLTLSGTNTYTGATTLSGGGLTVSGGSAIGDTSAVSVGTGTTLTLSSDETIGSLAGAGSVTLGANTLTAGGNNGSTTFSGAISGSGGLTKAGTGTLTLSGTNTYTGATTLSGGGLTVSGGSAIGDTSAVSVGTGTTLTLSSDETIGSLAGAGTVAIGANTLTTGADNSSTTFSGAFTGTGTMGLDGTGTLTLSGNNSGGFSGEMRVRGGGTLSVASDANLGGGTVTLNGGTLSVTGAGTIDNAFDTGVNGATIDTGAAVTLSGAIGGNDGLTKTGTGTLTLSGTSTYAGPTTVSAGTLLVAGALNGTSGMTVASGATLGGTGSIFAAGSSSTLTVASGATLAPGIAGTNNGIGTLTVNGNLSMSGTLAVEIAGTAAGSYDQVIVSGGVTLSSGSSAVTMTRVNGFAAANSSYTVINQTGAGAVSQTLSGLAQGATMTSSGDLYTVDYVGGTGNDLVLNATVNPTVSSVTATTADGTYKAGSTITITVTFNRAVTVTGTPSLGLGITGRSATYSGGSGTTTLTFTYTVQDGDNTTDLDYASTAALTLNGGSIADNSTSLDAILTLAAPGTANSLGANKAIVIDTAAPTVSAVSAVNGTYRAGETIDVTVTFSEAVTVTGTPTFGITLDNGTVVQATYLSGSGGTALTFRYTVGANLTDADGIGIGGSISGGSIADLIGNNAIRTLNGVSGMAGVRIDSVHPTVTNVTASTENGTYTTGETISIQVTFSEAVTVNGTPTLALNTGRTATYSGGAGTNTLTFTYTVQAGDAAADLDAAGTGALTGSITDIAGNAGVLTLTMPGDVRSLGLNKDIAIDTTAPAIRSIIPPADGTYGVGRTMSFYVQTSEVVVVNGVPTITLDVGGQTRQAVYNAAASSGTVLRFDYVVQAGDADADGIAVTGLNYNGGSITDRARIPLPATLTGMPGLQNVLVDTVAPATPSVPVLAPGQDTGVSTTDGLTNISRPTVGGTAEPGSTVTVLVDGIAVGTTIAGADGNWSFTPSTPLADGTHAITSRATDPAGNSSGISAALTLTVDATPPVLSTPALAGGIDNSANITPVNRPTLTGTADPNSTVTVIIDGVTVGTATAGSDGAWSFAVTTPLADGVHSVVTTATDPAGNIGRSGTLALTVDTQAPTVSTGGSAPTLGAGGTARLGSAVSLSDAGPLNRVIVTLTDARSGDELVIGALPAGITATRDGNSIVLTGAASASDYQAAVRAIGLRSSAGDPSFAGTATSRSISIQARDLAGNGSAAATVTVAVTRAATPTPATAIPATTTPITVSGNGPSQSGGSTIGSSSNGPSSNSSSNGPLAGIGSGPTLPGGGGMPGSSSSTDAGRSVTLGNIGGGSSSTDAGRSVTLGNINGSSSSTDAGRSVTLNSISGGSSNSSSGSGSGLGGSGLGSGLGGGLGGSLNGGGLGGSGLGGSGLGGNGLGSGLGIGGTPGETGPGTGANTGSQGTPDQTGAQGNGLNNAQGQGQGQGQRQGQGQGLGQERGNGLGAGQGRGPAAGQPGSQGQGQGPQGQGQGQGEPQGQPQNQPQNQDAPQDGGGIPADGAGQPAERGADDRAEIMPASPGFARQVARAHGDPSGAADLLAALASHILPDSRAA